MKGIKKVISFFLSILMVFTIIPNTAFASENSVAIALELFADVYLSATDSRSTISAGGCHSMAITADGGLWAWGIGVGDGTRTTHLSPVRITENVIAVSAGDGHTAAITADGSLWAWGDNSSGQIGDGTTTRHDTPVKIMDNVIAVSAGVWHTAAITTDGGLWVWGNNNSGQLGNGTNESNLIPIRIMENVIAVSAGNSLTMAITADGDLWLIGGVGNRWGGQFGYLNREDFWKPFKVMENVIAVSAGGVHAQNHIMAITADGGLWTWGSNGSGQLGDGTTIRQENPVRVMENVIAVSSGSTYSMAITAAGNLWAWGCNDWGVLGDGTTISQYTPVPIMENVISVSASGEHTIALTSDGLLWAWGRGVGGLIGDGTQEQRLEPVRIMDDVMLTSYFYYDRLENDESNIRSEVFGRWDNIIYSAKNVMLISLSNSWHRATEQWQKDQIHEMANRLRVTDDSSFDSVIFLNDSTAVGGKGHNGILLLNAHNQGFYFSYGAEINFLTAPGDMRFALLTEDETNRLLYGDGKIVGAVRSSGIVRDGQYDRFIYIPISNESGQNIYRESTDIFADPGAYNLVGNQCDNVARRILQSGGIGEEYRSRIIPNNSYDELAGEYHSWSLK